MDNLNTINQSHKDIAGVYQVGSGNSNHTTQKGNVGEPVDDGNFDWTLQISDGVNGSSNTKISNQTGTNSVVTLQGAYEGGQNTLTTDQSGWYNQSDNVQYAVGADSTNNSTVNQTGEYNTASGIQAALYGGSNTLTVTQGDEDTDRKNKAYTLQGAHGGSNTGTIKQTGSFAEANLYQSSFNTSSNTATITQDQTGTANLFASATVLQLSSNDGINLATVTQNDYSNTGLFQIAGSGTNKATINQSSGPDNVGSSDANVLQVLGDGGGSNTLTLTQDHSGGLANIIQGGSNGSIISAALTQSGGVNAASILQVGDSGDSSAILVQNGDGNNGNVVQSSANGGTNTADTFNQTGDNNLGTILQVADYGNNTASLTRTGNDNGATIVQFSSGTEEAVALGNNSTISQIGDNNQAVSVQVGYSGNGYGDAFVEGIVTLSEHPTASTPTVDVNSADYLPDLANITVEVPTYNIWTGTSITTPPAYAPVHVIPTGSYNINVHTHFAPNINKNTQAPTPPTPPTYY